MLKTRRPWLLALSAVLFASPVFAGDDSEAEDKKWDIDHPPYPTFEQSIDTTTGTWMSLDVSPDGRSIAFDLLGDLYTMPIAGGGLVQRLEGVHRGGRSQQVDAVFGHAQRERLVPNEIPDDRHAGGLLGGIDDVVGRNGTDDRCGRAGR